MFNLNYRWKNQEMFKIAHMLPSKLETYQCFKKKRISIFAGLLRHENRVLPTYLDSVNISLLLIVKVAKLNVYIYKTHKLLHMKCYVKV